MAGKGWGVLNLSPNQKGVLNVLQVGLKRF